MGEYIIITPDQLEWGGNLNDEISTEVGIALEDYITSQRRLLDEHISINRFKVNVENIDENKLLLRLSFPVEFIIDFDTAAFERGLISKLIKNQSLGSVHKDTIFQGENGYYRFYPKTARITEQKVTPNEEREIFIIIDADVYRNLEEIEPPEQFFEQLPRESNCRSLYEDYKESCKDLIDEMSSDISSFEFDKDVSTINAVITIERLNECIRGRQLHLERCGNISGRYQDGHIGAIQKMRKKRDRYIKLVQDRIKSYNI